MQGNAWRFTDGQRWGERMRMQIYRSCGSGDQRCGVMNKDFLVASDGGRECMSLAPGSNMEKGLKMRVCPGNDMPKGLNIYIVPGSDMQKRKKCTSFP